jgi:hypothetical protein
MMRNLREPCVWCLAVLLAAVFSAPVRAQEAKPPADPSAVFDRGADLLAKDPFAAKASLAKAAAGYERMLALPLSQQDRARVLYNLGVARQLGGDLGPAVLALRRAELLMPALPGLAEHLVSAQAAARGEPAPDVRGRDVDAGALARAWALSIPRHWLWRAALGSLVVFWSILLVRTLVSTAAWRPSISLAIAAALVGVLAGGLLAEQLRRDRIAERRAVVIADVVARSQPDDLIGQPSAAGALKPGSEITILEERTGGNGQTWFRVRPPGAVESPEETSAWIPSPTAERISARAGDHLK